MSTRLLQFLATVVVLCAVPATADARLQWRSCYAEVGPNFQCAVAQVPLDHSRPHGPTISLALTRLPATDQRRRIGSLFLNPGGPGGSGVDFVLGAGPFLYTPEVRARFDLVGFDPRGVMRSTPLRCFRSETEWPPFPDFAFPLTPRAGAASRSVSIACWTPPAGRGRTPIRDHMSTANVARDLDMLRAQVGDDKLTFAGVLLRLLPGGDLRQPVPEPRTRAGRGRRAGSGRLGHRARARRASWSRSPPGCAATRARWRRCGSSSGCATRAGRAARSRAARPRASRRSRASCASSRSRSSSTTARRRRSTTRS